MTADVSQSWQAHRRGVCPTLRLLAFVSSRMTDAGVFASRILTRRRIFVWENNVQYIAATMVLFDNRHTVISIDVGSMLIVMALRECSAADGRRDSDRSNGDEDIQGVHRPPRRRSLPPALEAIIADPASMSLSGLELVRIRHSQIY
jgi:hypothetical protein